MDHSLHQDGGKITQDDLEGNFCNENMLVNI